MITYLIKLSVRLVKQLAVKVISAVNSFNFLMETLRNYHEANEAACNFLTLFSVSFAAKK